MSLHMSHCSVIIFFGSCLNIRCCLCITVPHQDSDCSIVVLQSSSGGYWGLWSSLCALLHQQRVVQRNWTGNMLYMRSEHWWRQSHRVVRPWKLHRLLSLPSDLSPHKSKVVKSYSLTTLACRFSRCWTRSLHLSSRLYHNSHRLAHIHRLKCSMSVLYAFCLCLILLCKCSNVW